MNEFEPPITPDEPENYDIEPPLPPFRIRADLFIDGVNSLFEQEENKHLQYITDGSRKVIEPGKPWIRVKDSWNHIDRWHPNSHMDIEGDSSNEEDRRFFERLAEQQDRETATNVKVTFFFNEVPKDEYKRLRPQISQLAREYRGVIKAEELEETKKFQKMLSKLGAELPKDIVIETRVYTFEDK